MILKQFCQCIAYYYMDEILLDDSYIHNLEIMFEKEKYNLVYWELQVATEKI